MPINYTHQQRLRILAQRQLNHSLESQQEQGKMYTKDIQVHQENASDEDNPQTWSDVSTAIDKMLTNDIDGKGVQLNNELKDKDEFLSTEVDVGYDNPTTAEDIQNQHHQMNKDTKFSQFSAGKPHPYTRS